MDTDPILSSSLQEVTYNIDSFPKVECSDRRPDTIFEIVVPICEEYSNGNLARFLETILGQTDNRTEWTFIVNHESSTDERIKEDNSRSLEVLSAISRRDQKLEKIDQKDTNLVKRCVKSGMQVNVVDARDIEKFDMGAMRKIGDQYSVNRLNGLPVAKNGLVLRRDIDTYFPKDYIKDIAQVFLNPDIELAINDFEYTKASESDEDFLKWLTSRYLFTIYFSDNVVTSGLLRLGTNQITLRSTALDKLGTLPSMSTGEDVYLGMLVQMQYGGTNSVGFVDSTVKSPARELDSRPDFFDSSTMSKFFKQERHVALNEKRDLDAPMVPSPLQGIVKNILKNFASDSKMIECLQECLNDLGYDEINIPFQSAESQTQIANSDPNWVDNVVKDINPSTSQELLHYYYTLLFNLASKYSQTDFNENMSSYHPDVDELERNIEKEMELSSNDSREKTLVMRTERCKAMNKIFIQAFATGFNSEDAFLKALYKITFGRLDRIQNIENSLSDLKK